MKCAETIGSIPIGNALSFGIARKQSEQIELEEEGPNKQRTT